MLKTDNIVRVDPVSPDKKIIQTTAKILNRDGVIIFPAACMYGVAANALSPEAVEKVFALKQRPKGKAILVLVPDFKTISTLVTHIPAAAEKLISVFWPGKLTLVFEAAPHLPGVLTAGTGKIGIRQPGHPVARALVKEAGIPLTGTSANLSGRDNCVMTDQLPPTIIAGSDLILDAGWLQGGVGSTLVDVTTDPVQIIREGRVSEAQILAALS